MTTKTDDKLTGLFTLAVECERTVLGGILVDCDLIPPAIEMLMPGDFFAAQHAQIFEVMQGLMAKNEPVDEASVSQLLGERNRPKVGWFSYLARLAASTPTSANTEYYANKVRAHARRRDFIKAAERALEKAKDPAVDGDDLMTDVSLELAQLAESRSLMQATPMSEIVKREFKAIERRAAGEVTGVSTGYPTLDELNGGMPPGGMIVIAARPGMGKTALSQNIIRLMTDPHGPAQRALIFSLEMTEDELGQRSLACEGEVNLRRIRSGKLFDLDYPKLARAAGKLYETKIDIIDKGEMSISELRSTARQHHARHQVDVIVVDYLQLMTGTGDNREQHVSSITRGLKALAKEIRVPVIALSQLNRSLESRSDKRPVLADLRESGSIEQDADQVIFIYRDEYYDHKSRDQGIAEICVGKNRNGPTGLIRLQWSGQFVRFDPMDYERSAMGEQAESEYEYEQ